MSRGSKGSAAAVERGLPNHYTCLLQGFNKLAAKDLILKIVMETTNLSADGRNKTVETLFCSASLTAGLHSHLKISLSF